MGKSQPNASLASHTEYFDMLADLGVTKHIGSLKATEKLVTLTGIGADTRVLDAGCGVGLTPCYLARTYGCRVVGIDITPGMIDLARREASRRGLDDRLRFAIGDVRALPFGEAEFDVVLVESVNTFLNDRAVAFREYVRVALPGGRVGVTESTWLESPSEEARAFMASVGGESLEQDDWTAFLAQAGLEDVVAEAYRVDVTEEARGNLRRFGCLGLLRPLLRIFPALTHRRSREVLSRSLAKVPSRVMRVMGYGIYVGRKPAPDDDLDVNSVTP